MTRMTTMLQRSAWLAWALLVASMLGAGMMMADTEPPFRMLSYTVNSPRPGELLRVNAQVERQLDRGCSVRFGRYILDSTGTRMDVLDATQMTAAAVRGLDAVAPGRLSLAVRVPDHAAPGKAHLVTPLAYTCNAWHAIRPIETTMVVDFEIAP